MGRKSRCKKSRRKKPKRKKTRRKRGGMKIPFMRDACFQKCPYGVRQGTAPFAPETGRTSGDCFHQCAATMMNSDEFYKRTAHPSVKIKMMAKEQGPQKISHPTECVNRPDLIHALVSLYVEIPPGFSKMVIITKNHAVSNPFDDDPYDPQWVRPFWFEYPLNPSENPALDMVPKFHAGGWRIWHVVIMARDREENLYLIDPKHRVMSSNSDIWRRPWLNKFCPSDNFWAGPGSEFGEPDIFNEACHWGNSDFFRLHHWDGIQFRTVDNAENNDDKTGLINNEEERGKILSMFRKNSLFKYIFFPDEEEERLRKERAKRERAFLNNDTDEEGGERVRAFWNNDHDEDDTDEDDTYLPKDHHGWVFNENDAAKINFVVEQEGVIPGAKLQEKWKKDAQRRLLPETIAYFAHDDARRHFMGPPAAVRQPRDSDEDSQPQEAAADAAPTLVTVADMPETYEDGDNFVPLIVRVQNPPRGVSYTLTPSLLYAEGKTPVPNSHRVVTFSCHKCAGCSRGGQTCNSPSQPCIHALSVSSSDPRATVMMRFSNDRAMTERFVVRVGVYGFSDIYVDSRPVTVSVGGSTPGPWAGKFVFGEEGGHKK